MEILVCILYSITMHLWLELSKLEVYPSPCDGDRDRVPNTSMNYDIILLRNTPTVLNKTVIVNFFLS